MPLQPCTFSVCDFLLAGPKIMTMRDYDYKQRTKQQAVRLSGVVVSALAFGPRGPGLHASHATILLGSNLGKLFTGIASPVFSSTRNWGTKRVFGLADLTA